MPRESDILVIGSGIAGLTAALKMARFAQVTVVTKKAADDTATAMAQGGIAAVMDPGDSFESHLADTLTAGAGLCHPDAVEAVVRGAPRAIRDLEGWGARFTRSPSGALDLGQEGAHSRRRIVHAEDMTGREVQRALLTAARQNPRIRILENHTALNLVTRGKLEKALPPAPGEDACFGAYIHDAATGEILPWRARATVLASGGAGKAYLYTSDPDTATGAGIAMAYRAGADVANMEFIQFHPTCLFHPMAKSFLISEAVRGEGAILRTRDGEAFMERYDPRKELAPRDVVARAIDAELKRRGDDYVLLDITHKSAPDIIRRFPNIYRKCLGFGFDMTKEPLPVVPAAHYTCGGVVTDLRGRTGIPGLWAVGETACTGLHGANRLASNSLLEGAVMADRAAGALEEGWKAPPKTPVPPIPAWDPGRAVNPDEMVVVTHNWDEVRRTMWNYVGIVRTTRRLLRAQERVRLLQREADEFYWNFLVTRELIELREILTVAHTIIRCALLRQESRGLHYTLDFPRENEAWRRDTVINVRMEEGNAKA